VLHVVILILRIRHFFVILVLGVVVLFSFNLDAESLQIHFLQFVIRQLHVEFVFQVASEFLVFFGLGVECYAFKSHMRNNKHKIREVDHLHFFKLLRCLVCYVPFGFDMVNLMTLVAQMVLVEYFIAVISDARVQPFTEILHLVEPPFV